MVLFEEANILCNNKEYTKAIDAFRTVLKIDDTYTNAYYNLGYAYSRIDDYKKAYCYFNIAWS